MLKRILSAFLYSLILYTCVLIALYLNQRSLMYYPNQSDFRLPEEIGMGDLIQIDLPDQEKRVIAWYKLPKENRPTIVFFHGNAGSLHHRQSTFEALTQGGEGLIAVSYPGFGSSEGEPTESAIYQAALASVTFMKKQGVLPSSMIYFGESLGTAVAIETATHVPPQAIILQSPFTRMHEAASYHYPWVIAMSHIVKDQYDSLSKIPQITTRSVVIHGKNDGVVPFFMGKAIFEQMNEPKESYFIESKGHHGFDYQQIYERYIADIPTN